MSRITEYTALASVQTDDVLVVVDVHDTTMSTSGTTKKMTISQLPFDPTGAAAAAQAAAQTFATGAVATETTRAQAAEALALPLTGGTMSGVIAMGAHKITGVASGSAASDVAAFGQTPAGGAIVSGQFLCAPHVYNPGTPANPAVSSATLAAFDSTNITTNSFVAPPSGSVVVGASFVSLPAAVNFAAYALGAHGTVSPVIGNAIVDEISSGTNQVFHNLQFVVTGLTPGNTYQFDLLGAIATGSLTIKAAGVTSTTPTAAVGAPVVMTVQAV